MQSGIDNGVMIKSDVDVLTSEKINIEQQLTENEISKISFIKVLSDLTGKDIDTSAVFIVPTQTIGLSNELLRPELQLIRSEKGTTWCRPEGN